MHHTGGAAPEPAVRKLISAPKPGERDKKRHRARSDEPGSIIERVLLLLINERAGSLRLRSPRVLEAQGESCTRRPLFTSATAQLGVPENLLLHAPASSTRLRARFPGDIAIISLFSPSAYLTALHDALSFFFSGCEFWWVMAENVITGGRMVMKAIFERVFFSLKKKN